MIVVDASFLVCWLLKESLRFHTRPLWDVFITETAFVPTHWPKEVAKALRRAVRTKRLKADEIEPMVRQRARSPHS